MNVLNLDQEIVSRFWSKVNIPEDLTQCWIWTTGKTKDGYGQFWNEGTNVKAHSSNECQMTNGES